MAKNEGFKFDAAGWLFWTVVLVLLTPFCIYGSLKIVFQGTSRVVPIGMGVVLAAVGAGLVSWSVNAVIQARKKKQRQIERKKAKKRK